MKHFGKLAILGGDTRQKAMIHELQKAGWKTVSWGLGCATDDLDWQNAIHESDGIILPLPASADGVRIRCPLDQNAVLRFSVLLEHLKSGARILGGKIPAVWRSSAEEKGFEVIDYFDSELLQLRNALPTAEGAIYLAMQELSVTLDGSCVAVIGYGRIASLLSEKLKALGADVTVYARKPKDIEHARLRHLKATRIVGEGMASSLCLIPSDCRIIFNTVPECIFNEPILQSLPNDCILMELASAPGGFDPISVERLGKRRILASALPGKYFPESAGKILAETVSELLSECFPPTTDPEERN